MAGDIETLWQVSGKSNVLAVCMIVRAGAVWTLSISYGADEVYSEDFTERDAALKRASAYLCGLVENGWTLIPSTKAKVM